MGVPDSICPVPWINLSLDVDGTSRPCCKFAHLTPDSPYQLASLKDASLEEVWRSEAMQQLRRDFRSGVKPAECSTCWDEEDAGIRSYRQTFKEYRGIQHEIDYDDLTPESPHAFDLKLTNVCNLKCRICGPVASSLWLKEEIARSGEDSPDPEHTPEFLRYVADNREYFLSNKITRQAENREIFRGWIPHLEYLEITGGEPMLSPENREIIEMIVAEGRPERISLLFNTNVTVIDRKITRHLDKFKDVKICLSLDDIGRRLEYERAPADWETVQKNLASYAEMASSRCKLYAFCSVNFFNAWYMPEYVEWLTGTFGRRQVEFKLNLVHSPRHFCVQVLPTPLKDAIKERLSARILDASYPRYIKNEIKNLIEFMYVGHDEAGATQWQRCLDVTAHRDGVRRERFAEVFPELHAELARLGLLEGGAPRAATAAGASAP